LRIVFGIGNPGPEYAGTRHNLGFSACDAVAAEAGAPWRPVVGLRADGARVRLGSDEIWLLKPMAYVNRCGPVLEQARTRLGLGLCDLLVVVDDLNLPLGRLRLRKSGSDGGHNGLRSLQAHLGSVEFPRLRIGISGPNREPVERYVLARFPQEQVGVAKEAVRAAKQAIRLWITRGIENAMGEVNRRS